MPEHNARQMSINRDYSWGQWSSSDSSAGPQCWAPPSKRLPELCIVPARADQLFVRPALDHPAIFEHDDPVGTASGLEAVSD